MTRKGNRVGSLFAGVLTMATKSKAKSPVRPHDVKVPPPPKPTPPGANHRHAVPQGVERRAQELVHEAGSVHQAKKAIDSADVAEGASDFREDQLALQWGFRSRKDMLAASKPIRDGAGDSWWTTKIAEGHWVVWNAVDLKPGAYATLEEATQGLLDREFSNEQLSNSAFPEGFNG